MSFYRLAGRDFYFPYPVTELEAFETKAETDWTILPLIANSFSEFGTVWMVSRTEGWVGNMQRSLEVWNTDLGAVLKVDGCGEYLISSSKEAINPRDPQPEWSQHDWQVILGPALVLALALRGTWCLHASAVIYEDRTIAFVGEFWAGQIHACCIFIEQPELAFGCG